MGKRKKAIISLILCILSFKRICMLVAIIFFVLSKWLIQKKPVSKKMVFAIVIIFVLLPTLTCVMLNDAFEAWFYQTFHITLYEATLSRSSRIEAVMNSGQIKYSDRQKLKTRKNWSLFKKNCSRKSKSQATQRFF